MSGGSKPRSLPTTRMWPRPMQDGVVILAACLGGGPWHQESRLQICVMIIGIGSRAQLNPCAFSVLEPYEPRGEIMFRLLYDHWQAGGVLHVDATVRPGILKLTCQKRCL